MRAITIPNLLIEANKYFVKSAEGTGGYCNKFAPRKGYRIMVDGQELDYIDVRTPDEDEIEMGEEPEWTIEFTDKDFLEVKADTLCDVDIILVTEESVF